MAAQKKYICAFCARAFTRSEHKQRHERSHTNEKPFHCLHCTSSFVRRDLLQRHCRTVHHTNLNPSTLPSNKSLKNPTTNPLDLSNNEGTTTTTKTGNKKNNSNKNGAKNDKSTNPNPVVSNDDNRSSVGDITTQLQFQAQFNTQLPYQQRQQQQQQQQYPILQNQGIPMKQSFSMESDQHSLTTFDSPTSSLGVSMTPSGSTNSEIVLQQQQQTTKRRKRSQENNSNNNTKLIAKELNHDLVHLLSITKKLTTLLQHYDNVKVNITDSFLIGYVHIQQQAKNFTIFEKILKDLVYYLNTYHINNLQQQNQFPPSQQQNHYTINHFKIGISYCVIALGFLIDHKPNRAIQFFKKSWNLLIKTLIPQYNSNNNLLDQIEILYNLFLLCYIYLQFNLETFDINEKQHEHHSYEQGDEHEDHHQEQVYINNQVILNYLNDISFIIVSNLKDVATNNLIDHNLNLFWNIYISLSSYITKEPPKIHQILLNKNLKQNDTLVSLMQKFSKSFINMDMDDEQLKLVVVAALNNELKLYFNDTVDEFEPENSKNKRKFIYDNRNVLHNAIILINKSINFYNPSASLVNDAKMFELKLFELFKKNLIINSPMKYHELFNNYIFIPQHYYHWQLLTLTLKEINQNNVIFNQIHSILTTTTGSNVCFSFIDFENLLKNSFLNYKANPIVINNNLLIISYPIIFLSNYLNLDNLMASMGQMNQLQFINLNIFIIEWYLIMMKVLIIIWDDTLIDFEDNYILQTLMYILLDNKSCLLKRLNIDTSKLEYDVNCERLSFNQKWFWIIKLKFDSIFENWMNFLKNKNNNVTNNSNVTNTSTTGITNTNHDHNDSYLHHFNVNVSNFKFNLNKYLNEYFVTGDFKFREQLDQNDPDQFQGSMSMDEEPDFTTAMQTSQTINSFMPIHNHNSRNQVYQQHNQDTPMTSRRDNTNINENNIAQTSSFISNSNYQSSNSNNMINYNEFQDRNYKRSSSITLGILAQTVAENSNISSNGIVSPQLNSQTSTATSTTNGNVSTSVKAPRLYSQPQTLPFLYQSMQPHQQSQPPLSQQQQHHHHRQTHRHRHSQPSMMQQSTSHEGFSQPPAPPHLQQHHQSLNGNGNIGSTDNGVHNSTYSSYSVYPPPPPILSSMSNTNGHTNLTAATTTTTTTTTTDSIVQGATGMTTSAAHEPNKADVLLPPIRH